MPEKIVSVNISISDPHGAHQEIVGFAVTVDTFEMCKLIAGIKLLGEQASDAMAEKAKRQPR